MNFLLLLLTFMISRKANALDASTENSNFTTGGIEEVPLLSGRMVRSHDHEVISAQIQGKHYDFLNTSRTFASFYETVETKVTVQKSKTAHLHCSIHEPGNKVVSWVRKRDLCIITKGNYIYTTSQRFGLVHFENSNHWTLEIRDTRVEDSGMYECQINTEPKMSLEIQLNIIVVETYILEAPIRSIKSGNPVNFTCHVKDQVGTAFIFWYHNGAMLGADEKEQSGIEVFTENGFISTSRLFIANAKLSDSGNYTCQPSYSEPAIVTLLVLNEETPVTIQRGCENMGVKKAVSFVMVALPSLVFFMQYHLDFSII